MLKPDTRLIASVQYLRACGTAHEPGRPERAGQGSILPP
jgi:hypothetical protein